LQQRHPRRLRRRAAKNVPQPFWGAWLCKNSDKIDIASPFAVTQQLFNALPATTLTAGHSRKSFGSAEPPGGSSCTHSPLPASSPCIACIAQARVPASPSVSAPHRGQRKPLFMPPNDSAVSTGGRLGRPLRRILGHRWALRRLSRLGPPRALSPYPFVTLLQHLELAVWGGCR
jgi:hypothetical protein